MSGFIGKVLGAFSRKTEPERATATMAVDEPSKTAKKRLFDEEDDDENASDSGAQAAPAASIGKTASFGINKEFAARFEHNKKREELQKLDEKYGSDDSSSSDDGTEDEDGYLLTEDLDARMSEALQAIKSKDPRVYKTDAAFFDAAEAERAGQEEAARAASRTDKKDKPMYLRDYHRERLLRGDIGGEEDDDDDNNNDKAPPKTYQQEQDEIKQALIDEMNAADAASSSSDNDESDDDAFIKPKAASKASQAVAASTGVHPSRAGRVQQLSKTDVESADQNPELFLSNFLASRAWVPEGDDAAGGAGWQVFSSDDEDADGTGAERAEEFEAAYNMRFEDPTKSNEVLKSYSRTVVAERSVRRSDKSARQRQREQERERQAAEKQARREERARLRKIKVDEAHAKLAKIKKAAGKAGHTLTDEEWMAMLDDAWDNDAWESRMAKQFGEDYYAEKDAAMGEMSEEEGEDEDEDDEANSSKGKKGKKKVKKPKWDDDIDIKDIVPDFDEEAAVVGGEEDDDQEEGEEDDDQEEGEEDDDQEEGEEADDDDDDDGTHTAKRRKTGKDHKKDHTEAKRDARRERARIEALVDRQMALEDPTIATASAGPSTGVNTETVSGFRYRETSPQAFGLTARDILLAPSDAALNEFAGLKKLATFRDEERKRKDRRKLGKKARLRQWRRDTFGADYVETGPTYGFEKFVEGDDGEKKSSGKEKDKKEKSKDNKGKGKKKADDNNSADTSGKKKRKRSGRSGKAKEGEAKAGKA